MSSKVDFRVARVENYWVLGLYKLGENEPYEFKTYNHLGLLLSDIKQMLRSIEHEPQEWEIDILDILNMKKEDE